MRGGVLTIGFIAIGLAWIGPLPALSERSFAAHMTLHMIVVAVAAPLIAAGLSARAIDPVRKAGPLFAAIPASLVELIVVWAWHTPALHHAARARLDVFVAEQASFLAAGLFLWLSILGGDRSERPARASRGIVALLLTFAHMTMLGALLALTPRPLYRHDHAALPFSALADQQIGGTIMLAVGALSYIGGALWLSRELLLGPRMQEAGP